MKTLYIAFALLIFTLNISAQNKISGFGKLQLGMSINDIPELLTAKKLTSSDDFFDLAYNNTSKKVYELVCDTNEKKPYGNYDTRVREFQLGRYKITESIEVTDVSISFFNDKLFLINIKDPKIRDLLTIKYGEGKLTTKEEDHTFQNGFGAKFVKTDKTFTTTWETGNPNVSCTSVLMSWYNNSGEKSMVSYSKLEDTSNKKEIEEVNNKARERVKNRLSEEKKKEIEGF